MINISTQVKTKLFSIISDMEKHRSEFVQNPNKDFVRSRKLSFSAMVKILISMGGSTLQKELYNFFDFDTATPTSSAFIQQRSKLLPSAFKFLMRELNRSFTTTKEFRGYRLLAVDGSDAHTPTYPDDKESYIHSNENGRGFNLIHVNTLYDLLSKRYEDVVIQKYRLKNENKALCEMIDCSEITDKVILLADRYYESYNNMAHAQSKGWNYLFRIKDTRGIMRAVTVPDKDEFDIEFNLLFTRVRSKKTTGNPDKYKVIPSAMKFDYLQKHSKDCFPMYFRIVRVKISDSLYETLVTNLKKEDFSSEDLKKLYSMRWGVETAFRELKYNIGLNNFHSKKPEFVLQEILARLIMYNVSMIISINVCISQEQKTYVYQINFSVAIHICVNFIRHNRSSPKSVEDLIKQNILPVRPGRSSRRLMKKGKPSVSFIYRV